MGKNICPCCLEEHEVGEEGTTEFPDTEDCLNFYLRNMNDRK